MLVTLLLVSAMAVSTNSCTAPAQQNPLGEYTFSKWWFDIYQARLYQSKGAQAAVQAQQGTLLQLTYLRDISHQDLVKQTQEQWQAMPLDPSLPVKQWLKRLNAIWPNVQKGDCIAFKVTQEGAGSFYLGTRYLGEITDPRFAKAFLAIWLGKHSQYPEQRANLLGE
ncbi:chalcone isomerase family protein [Celerinatantimonas diazotrophica]|uniref:Chalcone isomerase-like protein n=1 Tax=Celerinatantimonas diazotrophica TaxID=412034 RepID=A0A4R1K417_9GAMM|nr:chalcone isomerase family protein [Celerinatantimonas diazotrophica]TCK58842.1 chalcone isomerase-like protein [Celerinatantimonas diazotrophica]CAG9297474.1 hypothetical protein CEDIAZO_02659 [Celerinatantimonas diazotrophica]